MIKTYGARKLGVRPAHRKMMLRQLATSLLHHEKITTTRARAKELKVYAERLISKIGKIEDRVRANREALRVLAPNGFNVTEKLLGTLGDRYKQRKGGYVRVLELPLRSGDRARLSRVELVS